MIEHLRVFNKKGLSECLLLNIGQMNVVCGKNNSGKTTLLEAIVSRENRRIGRSFGSEEVESLIDGSSAGHAHSENQHFRSAAREVLSEIVGSRSLWFPEDAESFASQVQQRVSQTVLAMTYN